MLIKPATVTGGHEPVSLVRLDEARSHASELHQYVCVLHSSGQIWCEENHRNPFLLLEEERENIHRWEGINQLKLSSINHKSL